jgi:hypothetical protein
VARHGDLGHSIPRRGRAKPIRHDTARYRECNRRMANPSAPLADAYGRRTPRDRSKGMPGPTRPAGLATSKTVAFSYQGRISAALQKRHALAKYRPRGLEIGETARTLPPRIQKTLRSFGLKRRNRILANSSPKSPTREGPEDWLGPYSHIVFLRPGARPLDPAP